MHSLDQGLQQLLVKPIVPSAIQQYVDTAGLQQAAYGTAFCPIQRRELQANSHAAELEQQLLLLLWLAAARAVGPLAP